MNFPPAVAASAIPGPTTYGAAVVAVSPAALALTVITPRSLAIVSSRPSRLALIDGAELRSGPIESWRTGPGNIFGSTIVEVDGNDP